MKDFGKVSDLPPEFTQPALIGLGVVLVTCLLLFVISSASLRRAAGSRGSKYVRDDNGTGVVRRSMRSAKKPERWEPQLTGGESYKESPLTTVEKAVSKAVRTPRNAAKEVAKLISEDSPAPRPRGRPPGKKSDNAEPKSPRGGAKSKPKSPSPPRTRRVRSPRSPRAA